MYPDSTHATVLAYSRLMARLPPMKTNLMRLATPLALGAALLLSTPAFAQDKKADASASNEDSKQTPAAPAASETIINLKVTGMT